MSQIIELYPQEILVNKNGEYKPGKSVNAALFLYWNTPNGTLQMAKGEKSGVKLKNNTAYTKFPINNAENKMKNKLVKVLVQGPSELKVEVIVAKTPGLLEKFIAGVVNTGFSLISITNPLLGTVKGLLSSTIQGEIKKERIISLGAGYYDFNPTNPPETINFDLKVPTSVKGWSLLDADGHPIDADDDGEIVLLQKNDVNGRVVLRVNHYQA